MKIMFNKSLMESTLKIGKKLLYNKKSQFKYANLSIKNSNEITILIVSDEAQIKFDYQVEIVKGNIGENITVDLKKLEKIVKAVDGTFLDIENIDNTLFINGNNTRSKIELEKNIDLCSYKIEIKDSEKIATVDFKEFSSIIKNVSCGLSNDDTRPVLKGYYMELKKNNLLLTSIDGFRTVTEKIWTLEKNIENYSCIIPGKELLTITQIKGKNEVEIFKYKNNSVYSVFKIDNIELIIRNIDGEFIEYEKLYRQLKEYNFKVNFKDAKKLTKVLKSFKDTCKTDRNCLIKLELDPEKNQVKIFNNNMSKSVDIEILKYDNYENKNFLIAFNLNYLLDSIKNLAGEFEAVFTTNVNPIIVKKLNYKHLLLPVRLAKR